MNAKLKQVAEDMDLRFPIFTEDTPPPRLTMDQYYHWMQMMHEIRFPRSPDAKIEPDPGPCPVRFTLDR